MGRRRPPDTISIPPKLPQRQLTTYKWHLPTSSRRHTKRERDTSDRCQHQTLSPTALPNDQRDKSQDTEEAISPQTSQGMRDAVAVHNPLLPLQESATTEQESIGQSPPLSSTPKPRKRKEKELLDLQLPGSTPLTTRRTSAEPGQYRKPQHSQLVTSPNYRIVKLA